MLTLKRLVVFALLIVATVPAFAQDQTDELGAQLKASDVAVRLDACRKLAELGVQAEGAIPQLIESLRSPVAEEQHLAALALASMGESAAAAVPALIENLSAKADAVRAAAAYALGKIGPAARDATSALAAASSDEDLAVQHRVWAALQNIDPAPEVVLPLFAEALGTASPSDAATLADFLADSGESAVPFLVKALENKGAAYWASLALERIGSAAAPAVPALGKVLNSDEAEVRMQALIALAAIGKASRPLAQQIGEIAKQDPWISVRYAAAFALGATGDKAMGLPILAPMLDEQDEFLRVTSASSYVQLAEGGTAADLKKAIEVIAAGAASTQPSVRDVAIRALADPDIPAALVQSSVKNALQGIEDPDKRLEMIDALASLGAKAVPHCIESLQSKSPLRYYTLQLLIQLGPEAAPAVDALIGTLADPEVEMRREALFALGAIGAAASSAVDQVTAMLADRDAEVRHAACYALGEMGPAAKSALPQLKKAMESDDTFLQIAAVLAGLKIDAHNEDLQTQAIPRLINGLTDEREHVRIECAAVLGDMGLGDLGQLARPALTALQGVLHQDSSQDVRAAAKVALEQIGK